MHTLVFIFIPPLSSMLIGEKKNFRLLLTRLDFSFYDKIQEQSFMFWVETCIPATHAVLLVFGDPYYALFSFDSLCFVLFCPPKPGVPLTERRVMLHNKNMKFSTKFWSLKLYYLMIFFS